MPSFKTKSAAGYDVHLSVIMVQTVIAGLKAKTGRSLGEDADSH